MMYNENLHEEEQHLIQQIAEQTERGKIDWELTEYNPLSFLNEDGMKPKIILKLRMRFPLTVTAMNAHRRKWQSDLRTAPLSVSATPSFLPRLGRRI